MRSSNYRGFGVTNKHLVRVVPRVIAALLLTTSCITPSEKKGMKDDIFNAQTRLLNLERLLADTSKEGRSNVENASKRLASTQSELERLSKEMQQVHGDIDALKVGVTTGQMPGIDAAQQENSISAQVAKLSERLTAIEQSQEELLDAIKKAGLKSNKKKADNHTKPTDAIVDLQQTFDHKKYKQVIDEAPKVIKSGSADEKEQARFLLAESYYKTGKLREAALKYNDFLDGKPSKKNLPLAKMRMGDCFKQLGDAATAKVYYEELIRDFPDSDEAARAKKRLAEDEGGESKG